MRLASLLLVALLAAPVGAQDHVVTNAAELQAALGSDRTITLEPGDYVFESALKIEGLRNLTLRGQDRAGTRILARDDYADVVVLADSQNVTFENLTMGHHPDVAYCVGGVLAIWRSREVRALSLTLFGSGVEGITMVEVDGALVEDVEIRECTSSGMSVAASRDVLVRNSVIHENEVWGSVFNVHSSTVVLEDTRVAHAGEEAVDLVTTRHVPYFMTHEGWKPPEDGTGSFTMRGGAVTGAVKVPMSGVPDVHLEGVDSSGAGSSTCAAQERRIQELEAEVSRLREELEQVQGSGQ